MRDLIRLRSVVRQIVTRARQHLQGFLLRHGRNHADGDPDLRFHRVRVGPEKRLDAQMLLDPFEKQLDLPTTFVKLGDNLSGKLEIVGEETEAFVVLFVIKNDVTQILWIVVGRCDAGEPNGLITSQRKHLSTGATKCVQGKKIYKLGENQFAAEH